MPELYVDVDALTELASQLRRIKSALSRAESDVDAHDHDLGSSAIEDALDDFIGGWKDGREKIIEGIDGLLGRIDSAVATYREAETNIGDAARAGTK